MVPYQTYQTLCVVPPYSVRLQWDSELSSSAAVAPTFPMSGISFLFLKQGAGLHFPCLVPENPFFETGYYFLHLGRRFLVSLMCCLGPFSPDGVPGSHKIKRSGEDRAGSSPLCFSLSFHSPAHFWFLFHQSSMCQGEVVRGGCACTQTVPVRSGQNCPPLFTL